ncbi:putative aspartate transaminase [Acetomicrobium hydrogeniformans ATCC BAA-1850]|jgi:aspartate/methionine/tyrosine aminotransferase|uniref:Aminotransferase n=2 Tax=Acetomicrobium hydrogeniformans TaxID=649746 RepID=A0A0T5X824_9BACT|nr:putative aspartate transaminase [Acetomicrobium hydrogeniformans ATCC BAA-1850]
MFDLAASYEDVISLGIGEPGFQTPPHIVEAGVKALREGHTKYTPNAGIPNLREAIAHKMSDYGLNVNGENVMVTTGADEAILLSLLAITDPGDEVIIPDPCWPNYFGHAAIAGVYVKLAKAYEEDHFHLRAESIESLLTPRTKALIINTPSNPTGAALSRQELEEISEIALKHDLKVISDETYSEIIYDGRKHVSIASLPDMAGRTIVVNSFSKTYAMTGWRVGFAVGDSNAITQMAKLQESVSSCVNASAQQACLTALSGPQDCVREMVEGYKERRDFLLSGLQDIEGISCIVPEGSFYAFPNIKKLGISSKEAAMMFLKKARVVVVPGSAFGESGEGYIRISFCGSREDIEEGLNRLRQAMNN